MGNQRRWTRALGPRFVVLICAGPAACTEDTVDVEDEAVIQGASAHDAAVTELDAQIDAAIANMNMDVFDGMDAAVAMDAGLETWSDEGIAAVLESAHAASVDIGTLALEKAADADVREFASTMVSEYGTALADLEALLQSEGLGIEDNSLSRWMEDDAQTTLQKLADQAQADDPAGESATASEFDRAYVASQVTMKSHLLMQIDCQLMKFVSSPGLRDLIAEQRAVVSGHLGQAQALRDAMATLH